MRVSLGDNGDLTLMTDHPDETTGLMAWHDGLTVALAKERERGAAEERERNPLPKTTARIRELLDTCAEDGWDSYGAHAVVDAAWLDDLLSCWLMPCGNGVIALEGTVHGVTVSVTDRDCGMWKDGDRG